MDSVIHLFNNWGLEDNCLTSEATLSRVKAYLTLNVFPDLIKFFSNTLSSAGSSSSPTSSMISGLPKESESSKCVRKYLWFKAVI